MSTFLSRSLTTLATAGLAAALLTGCGSAAAPEPSSSTPSQTQPTTPSVSESSSTPSPSASSAAVSCDNLIVPDLLTELTAQGWTAKKTPLSAGGVSLSGGLQCTWTDYEVPSGNLMLFGWAPITAAQAASMQQGLESEGWLREESGGELYITEDPDQAPTVVDGYGMTYQFGNGWVTVADTKQNLLLIERPRG